MVEAADDICYTIIDFEDGINLGLIEEDYALEYLINLVKETINSKNYNALTNTEDRISYLRALAINTLINEAVELFMLYEDEILAGKFSKALLDMSKYKAQINDIIKISIQNIYNSKEVINKEIAGYEVINELLNIFTTTIYNKQLGSLSNYNHLILKVFPKTLDLNKDSLYDNLLSICNYVSKLSDSNAILTYRKLKGNHL